MIFSCVDCPTDQIPDAAGRACLCKPGFVRENLGATCTRCATGEAPNQEGTTCLSCDGTMQAGLGDLVGTCSCKDQASITANNEGLIFSQDLQTKGGTPTLTCYKCPVGQFPGTGWNCVTCDDPLKEYSRINANSGYTCRCKEKYREAGVGCVTEADYTQLLNTVQGGGLESSKSITYRSLIGVKKE